MQPFKPRDDEVSVSAKQSVVDSDFCFEESDINNRRMRLLTISQGSFARPGMKKHQLNSRSMSRGESISQGSESIGTERIERGLPRFAELNGRSIDLQSKDFNYCFAGLTEVPQLLIRMRLQHLNLAFNRLTVIDRPLAGPMQGLMTLDLSNNHLKKFPPDIQTALINLTTLSLAFNRLTEFPVYQGRMPQLISLNVVGNCLTLIPGYVRTSKLQKLFIEWKLFRESPEALSFVSTLDHSNNPQLLFTKEELATVIGQNTSLSCREFVAEKVGQDRSEYYWMVSHAALRLKAFGVLHSLVDYKPNVLLVKPPGHHISLLLWALQQGEEVFVDYLAANQGNAFREAVTKDPVGDLLQYLIKNK